MLQEAGQALREAQALAMQSPNSAIRCEHQTSDLTVDADARADVTGTAERAAAPAMTWDPPKDQAASRAELLVRLLVEVVASALRPLSEKELLASARQLLDQAWADWEPAELREALQRCEPDALRRLTDGRLVSDQQSGGLSDSMRRLAAARGCATRIAETEAPRQRPGESWLDAALFRQSLLNADQERKLARRGWAGDRQAINTLIEANTRLAAEMARRSRRSPALGYDDLFQEACLGLLRAAEKFDPALGYRFSTYASHWIRQALARAQANFSRTVRLPVHVHEPLVRLRATRKRLTAQGVHPITADLLAAELEMPVNEVRRLLTTEVMTVPMDAPALNIAERTAAPIDEMVVEREAARVAAARVRSILDERSLAVLLRRAGATGEPQTLEQVARASGVTRERIRQIENEAQKRVRAELNSEIWLEGREAPGSYRGRKNASRAAKLSHGADATPTPPTRGSLAQLATRPVTIRRPPNPNSE